MAKKIMRHLWQKRAAYMLSVLSVAVGIGFYASFFIWGNARALSGVMLVDTDTTGFGLDGRDFTVLWTPGSQPAGFLYTKIFLTTSTLSLTTSTVEGATGCFGSPCQMAGYFTQWSVGTTTVPQFMTRDSANNNLVTGTQYVAWVFVSTTNPGDALLVSSTAVFSTTTPGANVVLYDNVTDTHAPQIDHGPVHAAQQNKNAFINAFVFDDQTNGSQFANPGDGGAEYFRLYFATTTWNNAPLDGAAYAGQSELYSFTVPTSSVTSTGAQFKYYLAASDSSGNIRRFCTNPSAVSDADCQNSPFVVTTGAAGVRSVQGTITSGGSGLGGTIVFPGGFAETHLATTTIADGTYIINILPNNDQFDFTAQKVAYCRMMRSQTIGTANVTGVDMSLGNGSCGFFDSGSSGGGAGGSPMVMFSGPPDGMQNVPTSMGSFRVGFNQPMDGTTINDTNAADTGSNVYLTTDDGTTKIAGSVAYCSNNASPGCSSLFSMDNNTILFIPSGALASSTFYTLVVGPNVKSQGGQAISGNLPGGGHKIGFSTSGGMLDMSQFGQSGQFMPPYVKSMVPAPGLSVAPNTGIIVEFNSAMSTPSISNTNVKLFNITSGANTEVTSGVTLSLDNNEQRFVTISHSALSAGDYEVRVLGGAASASGLTMRPPSNVSDVAFKSAFIVAGSNDVTAPTIYPSLVSGSTGVAVNKVFTFGFNEQLSLSTITNSNITLSKGATTVAIDVKYDPGANNVSVVPNTVLSPNTVYTLTFTAVVTDLASNAIATSTYTYTTGGVDTIAPALKEAHCDDYTCKIFFSEPMNHTTKVDSTWASSTLNHVNISVTQGGPDKATASTSITYDSVGLAATITGVGLTPSKIGGGNFTLTVSGVADLTGNTMLNAVLSGPVDDSKETFGSFGGGDMGMFAPPSTNFTGGTVGGSSFTPMGFGSFTADQFAMGQASMAFPFNPAASQDANVFQIKFSPGVAVANTDKIVFTFPNGTNVTSAAIDTYSPFYADFNQFAAGTITSSAITSDSSTNKVTVTLGVSGSPLPGDNLTIDLKKITNPSVPKGPTTGGYTVGISLTNAAGTIVKASKTSMPYFIMAGGSNTITLNIVAGANTTTADDGTGRPTANGSVFVRGGGPSGQINKSVTLTNGVISAVDGASASNISLTSLNDGCYFFGTDPFVTLNGTDYFGQMSPEPVCVNGGSSATRYILLARASSGGGSVTTTVKITGLTFGGADLDIFAGGPGKFVVKSLTGVTTTLSAGYNLKLPANGQWFIGVGPAMPKGAFSADSKPKALPGVAPAPINVQVSGVGTSGADVTRTAGMPMPPGVTFDDINNIITFNFAAADKTVSGTVKDGSGTALTNVEVFLHRQGFGAPVFGTTNASGTFSLAVSDYGSYEIGASTGGMPPSFKQVEVRAGSGGVGTDIYLDGKQVTGSNPLALTLKKSPYTISGKVLDSNNNAISYAPVFAVDANGNMSPGQTGSDGSYTLYVDAGTWNVKAELPPDKTGDTCGTFSKTITITTESKSSQNITPSTGTCFTLSGSVTVGSVNLANTPIFIEQWDSTNSRPVMGGMHRGTAADSNGAYSVKLPAGTYRVGTFDATYGELSAVKVVSADDTQNISITATTTVGFIFTGANANMNGFVELKNSSDSNKRVTKQVTNLASSTLLTGTNGVTYNYFVDVPGVGKFTGQVVAGATSTINLGIVSTDFITVTGTIFSNASTTASLAGALVTFSNSSTGFVQTATANASGTYSMSIKSGTYTISAGQTGYVPGQASQNISFTTTTGAYDFGGSSPDQIALIVANKTIEGTIKDSTGATTTDGYVWATNASGTVVSAALDPATGHYSLPVTTGDWTIKAAGPNSDVTTKSGVVTVAGSNSTGNNITLTSDPTNVPTSTSGMVAGSSGGSVNDTSASGIKLTAAGGVLASSGNVTVSLQKTFTAPDSASVMPLDNATFKVSAQGTSNIKDLTGNAEIQLDYSSLLSQIPSGVSESDLKLMYYSSEKGDYVPVEGGFTIDSTNNTITGQTSHLTDFVIAYVPPAPVAAVAASAASTGGVASPITVAPPVTATSTLPISPTSLVDASGKPLTLPIKSSASSVAVFVHTLGVGSKGVEVRQLQQKLKDLGYYKYPTITGVFGPTTKAAVVAFQKAKGLKPYPGNVGPATRRALNALSSSDVSVPADVAPASVAASPVAVFVHALNIGSKGEEVRQLQAKLRELGYFNYPTNTGVFGSATKAAVVAFQKAKGLSPFPGFVGPGTRAALNSL